MEESQLQRVHWKENPNAVELGFDFYLRLLERRLRGERVSLVQSLRQFYRDELRIELRETQARGLMHRTSSVFIDYVKEVLGIGFTPGIQFWERRGIDQFYTWRDHFYQSRDQQAADIDMDDELVERLMERSEGRTGSAPRQQVVVNRIIRDSVLSRFLKSLYQSQCQICGFSFRLPTGRPYAESHHIRPLGKTHRGIDKETNMLILCPNHHAMMDFGVVAVHPDKLIVLSIMTGSPEHKQPVQILRHTLEKEFLEYHLTNIFGKAA